MQQGRALQAWLAFVTAKRAKRARLATALRLHHRRLQQEGVAQWLAVCQALHHQRMHQLALQQVLPATSNIDSRPFVLHGGVRKQRQEGVAQWPAVCPALHQQRMHHLDPARCG